MKILIILALILYSVSIKQIDRPELRFNMTAPIRPINEAECNDSSWRPINIDIGPSDNLRRGEGIRAQPFLEPIRTRIRSPRFEETSLMNVTSPIWSNRSILVGQPPINPQSFWTEKYRIIPPQFWDQNNTDAVLFINSNGHAISCDKDGEVKLTQVSKNKPNHLWFPEFLQENILRLRSYYGGYLFWDDLKHHFSCESRTKNFMTRWEIFLQISQSRRNQCLFLFHRSKLLGFNEKKLILENWSGDYDRFCFYGMPSSLIRWADRPQYRYEFDPSRIFSRNRKPLNETYS